MTRDEAIRKILPIVGHTSAFCEAWIDAYVALGMLKLDEPKSEIVPVKAQNFLHYRFGHKEANRLLEDLDASGLKIIEK